MIRILVVLVLLTLDLPAAEYSNADFVYSHGAVIRGPQTEKQIALVFTGGDFGDGGRHIRQVLRRQRIKATFFFTGDFYRNPDFGKVIEKLKKDGHYLGPHSDKHLLYCTWENRDSLLVSRAEFSSDLLANYAEMERFGIGREQPAYFMPPYEWYNDTIAVWAGEMGVTLVNYSPGTLSSADYTIPSMKNYRSSEVVYKSILDYEAKDPNGLNGFLLLTHIGTHADRADKFYNRLDELIRELKTKGYSFISIDQLLNRTGE